jgi:hypothetical protein
MSRLENVFRNSETYPEFHLTAHQISSYQAGEELLLFSLTENVKKKGLSLCSPSGLQEAETPRICRHSTH